MKGSLFGTFLKGISGFGGFALINQVGGFFLIPIYWKYLDPSDYGIIGIFTIIVSVLSALYVFGLNGTVERFFFEWNDEERNNKIKTLYHLQILMMVFLSAFLHLIFWSGIFSFNNAEYYPVVFLALMTSSFLSFQYIPFSIIRVNQKIKLFGCLSVFSFFLTALITIFLLAYADFGVEGYLYAQFSSSAFLALMWVWVIQSYSGGEGWSPVKEELKYSAPSTPLTLITRVSEVIDRVILERLLSLNLFGLYSFASQFGGYFNSVNSVLKLAFWPLIFKLVVKDQESPKQVTKLSLFYVLILAQLGLVAMVCCEAFVYWFGEKKFYDSFNYILFFIVAGFIRGVGTAFGVGIEIAKVPHKALYAVIPSSITAFALAVLLIPVLGVWGGIVALVAAAMVKSIISIYLGHRAYPRKFPAYQVGLIFAVNAIVVWGIMYFRADSLAEFLIKFFVVAASSLVLLIFLYHKQVFLYVQRCLWRASNR